MTSRPATLRLSLCCLALCLSAQPSGADAEATFTFGRPALARGKDCWQVLLAGGVMQPRPGEPLIPELDRHILLKPGEEAVAIEILPAVPETIRLSAAVPPCPRAATVSDPGVADDPAPADQAIYGSREPYPGTLARLAGQGAMRGYLFAAVALSPVQYLPADSILLYYHRLTVRVQTRPALHRRPTIRRPSAAFRRLAGRLAVNAGDRSRYDDLVPALCGGPARLSTPGAEDPFDCLIVTSGRLAAAMEPLARWKTRKGVRTMIAIAESLAASYPGADPAERLRAGISDLCRRSGFLWLLLAGDIGDVPHRVAAGYPGDLYFSDLDGDWNANRNAVWGEAGDGVDLYPDVFVGRLPVSDTAAAGNLVRKIIAYERAEEADYQHRLLFIGADLDAQTPTGQVKDSISAWSVAPYTGLTVDRLYPGTDPPLNRSNVLAAIGAGCNLVNFSDHADYYSMGTGLRTGGGQITLSDAAGLGNAGRPAVLYTVGCYNGAFDKSCIGERFLSGPNGAAAFIGCSREAWYIPGQPLAGVSYRYDREFFAALLDDSCYGLGAALGMAKARLIPSSGDGLMRWSQYEINLLGDPEMQVWTGPPRPLALSLPESLLTGIDTIEIAVADSANGAPLPGARVCLTNDHGLYAVAECDGAGLARFVCDPRMPDTLAVTVTAHDFRPKESRIEVRAAQRQLSLRDAVIGDDDNGDGVPSPGETFRLSVAVLNTGTVAAESLRLRLTATDSAVTPGIMDLSLDAPLAPGDSVRLTSGQFSAAGWCPDGRRVTLGAGSLTGHALHDSVSIVIRADSLALEHFVLAEAAGNDDGQADAGEVIELRDIRIGNHGSGPADGVRLRLVPLSPGIVLATDTLSLTGIAPRSGGNTAGAFRCSLAAAGPYRFLLEMADGRSRQWSEEFSLLRRPPAPAAPTVAADPAGLRIGWDAPAGAAGYAVFRAQYGAGSFAEITPLSLRNCLYYTDGGAAPDSGYRYAVAAIDTAHCRSALSDAAGNSAATPVAPGWPRDWGLCDSWNWNAPAAGDIDGDCRSEVLLANPSGLLHVWEAGGTALPGWPRRLRPSISGPMALADMDADQSLDILVPHGDTLSALRHDGTELAGWPYPAGAPVNAAAVCDLDRDGRLEIVVACGTDQVRALAWDGNVVSERWRWSLPSGSAPKLSIGDVSGGSLPEVVVTCWADAGTKGYVLDNAGQAIDSFASPDGGDNNVAAPALLADLDGDGKCEIVAAYLTGKALCAWDGGGALRWRIAPGTIWGTPCAFRASGDSLPRIAAATLEGYLCQFDRAGQSAPGWPAYWRSMHAAPSAADLDGDGAADLLCRGDYGAVTAWSAGGSLLPGFPIFTQDGNYSPVTVARLGPETGTDLLADTRGGMAYRWSRGLPAGDPPDWPVQGHDCYRSNRHGAVIGWCGRIARNMALSGDNFFTGDVLVEPGATLTVRPGARLYFPDRRDFDDLGDDPQRAELVVRGRLVVAGTADDSVFCDTWSGTPCDSSWHGIRIEPGGQAEIAHCGIKHSLMGLYHAGVAERPGTGTGSAGFLLETARPNPFMRKTTIHYRLPGAGRASLTVYNIAGQRIRTLVDASLPAGAHATAWDGRDGAGTPVPGGVYLVRLEAGGVRAVSKAVLLK